jgi:putative FmdB family regulatory protein
LAAAEIQRLFHDALTAYYHVLPETIYSAMPIYEYRSTSQKNCEFCREGFELMRKINDPELRFCPECGNNVKQIMSAPNLAKSSPALDAGNIEKHGFTQYKKSGKGVYEKTAGKGPRVITADPE